MTNATLTKFSTESDLFYIDCSALLAAGDTITAVSSASYLPEGLSGADALTFSSISINAEVVTLSDGRAVQAGGLIMVRITGGTPGDATTGRTYTVVVTFSTSNGNTKTVRGRLLLLPLGY